MIKTLTEFNKLLNLKGYYSCESEDIIRCRNEAISLFGVAQVSHEIDMDAVVEDARKIKNALIRRDMALIRRDMVSVHVKGNDSTDYRPIPPGNIKSYCEKHHLGQSGSSKKMETLKAELQQCKEDLKLTITQRDQQQNRIMEMQERIDELVSEVCALKGQPSHAAKNLLKEWPTDKFRF